MLNQPFTEPDFIEPDPLDPLDRNWQPPPEPDGPGWWLFGPDEVMPAVPLLCPSCAGAGTIDGFEPCQKCSGSGDNPSWWL